HARVQLAGAVLRESLLRGCDVDEAALAEALRREHLGRELTEAPPQEAGLRRDEAELVAPVADDRREQGGERAPQHRIRLAAADQLAAVEREGELDEPVVEERDARLERV